MYYGVALGIALVGTSGNYAFVGESAALLAAFFWAAATLMFGRIGKHLSPVVLNLVKGVVAIALLLLTLLFQLRSVGGFPALPQLSVLYLVLSGALGIGLGDTAYFSAINALGARRALLLETLAPPIAAVLAWLFLDERLPVSAIAGIAITLSGVAWVISERTPGSTKQLTTAGLRVALLATFCQAAGAVLSRAALADTTVSPLWSSLIRLGAGLFFMGLLVLWRPQYLERYLGGTTDTATQNIDVQKYMQSGRLAALQVKGKKVLRQLRSPRLLGAIALASFFATYLGIWLQQISLKYAATGIAQALLATSPLFVLPMAALSGEGLSKRSVWGVVVALGGVWLLLSAS